MIEAPRREPSPSNWSPLTRNVPPRPTRHNRLHEPHLDQSRSDRAREARLAQEAELTERNRREAVQKAQEVTDFNKNMQAIWQERVNKLTTSSAKGRIRHIVPRYL